MSFFPLGAFFRKGVPARCGALLVLAACGTESPATPAAGQGGGQTSGGSLSGGVGGGGASGAAVSGGSSNPGSGGGPVSNGGSSASAGSLFGGAANGGSASGGGGQSGAGGFLSLGGSGASSEGGVGQSGAAASGASGAPSGGAGGSGPVGGCPASATFCTGFEEAGIPKGAAYQPTYQAQQWADFVALDATQFREGRQSLMIKPTGSSGYSYRMLSVPAPAPSFWVRLYVRSDVDLGQAEHNAFFGASTGNGDQNQGDLMEVAEQYCQVVMNLHDDVVVSVGGAMACDPGGVKLAKDTWHCMEGFFDGPNGVVRIYADGKPVIDKAGWTQLTYQSFVFGFLGFHGPSRTMWYDQLALGTARIGCP